ncbi:efflux transporter periplasmic adaptor subunit [Polaribacter reichenbachii]|uniref:Efflux transporter periplasmic adaptor subunit n=1 Tax=Polaribacter reichenbachii TaxID=996801 RepID=A0A1B8U487_9FLAO|nr:efflux RND transporter periplasmic adaptor subunit [Polaribacter reichenbachii]APZ47440.1 efflux transporter periplasmic adaptor subunit [Polaribacter reichenbachii]AUC18079.1 efflux transporter periplasmic adaptor subunit [Polaribacter reichenbachii]OBY66690.1 efflux transporter periplasmic adaptor subunit [Polaribacter reichenbachii]
MKKNKKIIIISIVLVAIAVVAYSFMNQEEAAVIEAKTITAQTGNVTTMVTATGTIEPITQVEVGTQVSGVVEHIYVDYNSTVKEGQLIAELDKTNLKAAKIQAQAAYDNAVNQRNYMKTIYDRQQSLYDNQVISRADFDEAQYNYDTAKGTVTQRLSDLQSAKTNLEYANIYSPINGVVLSRAIDEGQTVAASLSTPTLFTIAQDLKEMQVEADVDEADIGQVKEGQRVEFTVDAYIGETFQGTVTQVRLDPTVTSNVVTYTVVIKADNPDLKLKPGLTATISVYTLELNNVLTVEAKAINFSPEPLVLMAYHQQLKGNTTAPQGPSNKNEQPQGAVVWVKEANGTLKPTPVTVGASDGVNVQIIDGIHAGDVLVYSLKATNNAALGIQGGSNESPFMPKPPGSNKKK